MKKMLLIVVLAMVMILAYASVAVADSPTDEGVAGTTQWNSGESVHSGWDTTTNGCKVCHDVHENSNAYLFVFDNVQTGCVTCHTSGGGGLPVYTGTGGLDATDGGHSLTAGDVDVPDSDGINPSPAPGIGPGDDVIAVFNCLTCHDAAPHGAGQGTLSSTGIVPLVTTNGTTQTDFCVRCHDPNDGRPVAGVKTTPTHVMVAKGDAYTGEAGTTAAHADDAADAKECKNCHINAAAIGGDSGDYPHTGNWKLLKTGAAALNLDTECLLCHGATVGVMY